MCIENSFTDLLSSSSFEDLNDMLDAVKAEISKRQPKPVDLIELIPDFCTDEVLIDSLWAECDSLGLPNSRNKVSTQWLSTTSEPYIYKDVNPVHSAKDINQYPAIKKLLSFVNASDSVVGPLDACLVLKYPSPAAALSLHADDEPLIDQTKSICPFSLGSKRTIEFFSTGKRSKCVYDTDLNSSSLLVMKPGTQQTLKHCIRAEQVSKLLPCDQGVRYCLSFRAIDKNLTAQHTVKPDTVKPVSVSEPELVPPKRRICVVAGDSFAARLDPIRLGKKKVEVRNIAVGGSKIADVEKQLEQFIMSNDDVIIEKVIISVGTNDIRYCRHGVDHLKGPLKKLCRTIELLTPGTKIFFQSLLPLPLKHRFDNTTPGNVKAFNRLLFNICKFKRMYFIDVLNSFLGPNIWGCQLRDESLFNVNDIHPNTRGLGKLASFYSYALTSRYFNPLAYQ